MMNNDLLFAQSRILHEEFVRQLQLPDLNLHAQDLNRQRIQMLPVTRSDSAFSRRCDPVPQIMAGEDWQVIDEQLTAKANAIAALANGDLNAAIKHNIDFGRSEFQLEWFQLQQANIPVLLGCDLVVQNGQVNICQWYPFGPEGLGKLLMQRLYQRRHYSKAFADLQVVRFVRFFDRVQTSIAKLTEGLNDPNIVILADPQDEESYSEYLFLADYMGYSVVQSQDLTVRDSRLCLKTLTGLAPIDLMLNWTGTPALDPLECAFAKDNGIVGLHHALREGQVTLCNPLYTAALGLLHSESLQANSAEFTVGFQDVHGNIEDNGVFRTFVLVDGDSIDVLPSAIITPANPQLLLEKEVWVQSTSAWQGSDVYRHTGDNGNHVLGEHILSSRSAESLFWLGMNLERTESFIRLLRIYIEKVSELPMYPDANAQLELSFLWQVFSENAIQYPFNTQLSACRYHSLHEYQSHLILLMQDTRANSSILNLLRQFMWSTQQIKNLLVPDVHLALDAIAEVQDEISQIGFHTPHQRLEKILDRLMRHLLSFRGGMADTLTNQNGAFMFEIGQRLSRSQQLNAFLRTWLINDLPSDEQTQYLATLLRSQVSLVTFKRRYRLRMSAANVVELLMSDVNYPRGLAYQITRLETLLDMLPDSHQTMGMHPLQQSLLQINARCHRYSADQLVALHADKRALLSKQLNHVQTDLDDFIQILQSRYFSHTELQDKRSRQGYISTSKDLL